MEYDSFTTYPEYLAKKNKKYAIRKALMFIALVVAWGLVCYFMSWSVPKV